jgi:hypothetical protein
LLQYSFECRDVVRCQVAFQQPVDRGAVHRPHFFQLLHTRRGDLNNVPSAVFWAGATLNQAFPLKPVDQAGKIELRQDDLFDNLIEMVNLLGSLFYGTLLGIFLVAFFLKKLNGRSIFPAAVISQIFVLLLHVAQVNGMIELGYLWYNLVGCVLVVVITLVVYAGNRKDDRIKQA